MSTRMDTPSGGIHIILIRAFERLEELGVRWALPRKPEGGLVAPMGPIHILVHPADLHLAADALRSRTFQRVPNDTDDSIEYLRYCENTHLWFRLVLSSSIGFGPAHPLVLDGEDGIFAKTWLEAGIRRLDGDTSFWLLLWDNLASGIGIDVDRRLQLTRLYPDVDPRRTGARVFGDAFGDPGVVRRITGLFRGWNWEGIEELGEQLRGRPETMTERPSGSISLRARIRGAGAARRKRRCRRGFTIAVIGPEGAGKTTLIEGLIATLPIPVEGLDMDVTRGTPARVGRLSLPGLRFLLAAILWSRYLKARRLTKEGVQVFFDRYVYDASAPRAEQLTPRQWREMDAVARLIPRPDFILLLDVPGTVAFERIGRLSPAQLEDRRWYFAQMKKRVPGMIVINASRSAAEVRGEVTARLWDAVSARWEG